MTDDTYGVVVTCESTNNEHYNANVRNHKIRMAHQEIIQKYLIPRLIGGEMLTVSAQTERETETSFRGYLRQEERLRVTMRFTPVTIHNVVMMRPDYAAMDWEDLTRSALGEVKSRAWLKWDRALRKFRPWWRKVIGA